MKDRATQLVSILMLFFVVLPSIVFSIPLLFVGIIPAGAAFDIVATNPVSIFELTQGFFPPKNLAHAAPLIVPLGFVGIYSLITAWAHLARGVPINRLNLKLIHPGMISGIMAILITQSFLQWKAYKLFFPLVGFLIFYAVYFLHMVLKPATAENQPNDL